MFLRKQRWLGDLVCGGMGSCHAVCPDARQNSRQPDSESEPLWPHSHGHHGARWEIRLRFKPLCRCFMSLLCVITRWFDLPSGTLLPFLTQLEVMDLSWNDLLGGSLKALSFYMQHVGKLKVLKLSGCRLTAEDLGALGERERENLSTWFITGPLLWPWIQFIDTIYRKSFRGAWETWPS